MDHSTSPLDFYRSLKITDDEYSAKIQHRLAANVSFIQAMPLQKIEISSLETKSRTRAPTSCAQPQTPTFSTTCTCPTSPVPLVSQPRKIFIRNRNATPIDAEDDERENTENSGRQQTEPPGVVRPHRSDAPRTCLVSRRRDAHSDEPSFLRRRNRLPALRDTRRSQLLSSSYPLADRWLQKIQETIANLYLGNRNHSRNSAFVRKFFARR